MLLTWFRAALLIGCCVGVSRACVIENEVDKVVKAGMEARGIPGLSLAIVKDGTLDLVKGYGVKDITTGDPVTADTIFGIASLSKAFTSTLLAKMLSDNPNYKLSTNIYKILGRSEAVFNNSLRSTYATLEDLMAHSMGISDNNFMRLDTALTRENLMSRLKYLPSQGAFRGSFMYNNLMYGLLTHITEVLGGPAKTWEELMTEEIFGPLDMTSATFLSNVNFSDPNVATPYSVDKKGRASESDTDFIRHYAHVAAGSGSIMASARDMSKYLLFHVREGKNMKDEQVVKTADLEETYKPLTTLAYDMPMSRPQMPVTMSSDGYALGWKVGYYRGYKVYQHTGTTYGYKALLTIMPHSSSAIYTSMTGSDDGYHFRYGLHSVILDLILGETPWINTTTIRTFPEPWVKENERKKRSVKDNREKKDEDSGDNGGNVDIEEGDFVYPKVYEQRQDSEVKLSRRRATIHGTPTQNFAGTFKHGAYGSATITYDATANDLKMTYGIGHWLLKYSGRDFVFKADCLGPSSEFDVQIKFLVGRNVYGFECLDCDRHYVPAFYRQA